MRVFTSKKNPAPSLPNTTPTPIQENSQLPSPPSAQSVGFDTKQTDKMINQLQHRIPLSNADQTVKSTLLNAVNNTAGVIHNEPNDYRIDYIDAPDLIQVEIVSINVRKAKTDAVTWLESQGMSFDGICKLPLTFYLNIDVRMQLQQNGTTLNFNPLAEGC